MSQATLSQLKNIKRALQAKAKINAEQLERITHESIVPADDVVVGDRLLCRRGGKKTGVFEEVIRVIRMPKGTMAILKNGKRRFLGNTYREYTVWR